MADTAVREAIADPARIDREEHLPPISPAHLAAFRRMNREPELLAEYEEGTWIAFSGEHIVAAGPILEDVVEAARAAGEPEPLMLPILPDPFLGVW